MKKVMMATALVAIFMGVADVAHADEDYCHNEFFAVVALGSEIEHLMNSNLNEASTERLRIKGIEWLPRAKAYITHSECSPGNRAIIQKQLDLLD